MKIRYKLAFLTFIYIAGISFFAIISIYSWDKNSQIQQSINLGVQLQKDSREVKSLMKDIVFDLFTPKMYGQIRSLTYSPRSAVTLTQWKEAVLQYKKTFADFMSISNFVKSSDEGLRDQYFTALMMNDRAMGMLDQMEDTLFILREQHRTTENLYNKMQKDESLTPFFTEVQETSYYFTNSFESFMNYFIRSLNEEGDRLRRRIIIIFIISAGAVSIISFLLTLYLVRDLSKKLRQVEHTFRQVSYGNFSVQMDINSRDEFGDFSKTFTTLVTNLKENVDSILNLTRDIGTFISDGSDLRSLLQLVVQAVVQDTTADAAFILRFEKNGAAVPEAEDGRTIKESDRMILQDFFSRRIIRPTSFIEYSPDAITGKDPELERLDGVTSMLAVPLIVEGRVFGVLSALKIETERNFSDLGIIRLRTFAEYASLSIDNFLKYGELLEKREAQYQALSSQVQPHFIYNVMSGILGLNARGDTEGLRKTVEALKGMLRYIQSNNNWSSLEEEFEFLEKYLLLQKIRFGERLEFGLELDDEIKHLQIPRLLLQPLVENAVIHGLEPLEEGGSLNVRAVMRRRLGEMGADIMISDSGAGFDTGDLNKKANIGLSNVRQRAQIAFPDSSFLVESTPGGRNKDRAADMKILIADDEELVRVGLRDTLMKIVPNAEIREAVNGRTMIESVEENQPDICFADIHMPGIDGLEAIEHLCLKFTGINWIVLSGYSDFEYARKALTLGVLDYLLKPATEDEVRSALKKAEAKMRESGLQKREKFEYRVGGVLNNSSAFEFDDYLIDIGSYAALVFIPGSKEADSSVHFQRGLSGEIRNWIDGEAQEIPAGLFSVLDGLPAVIAGGNGALKSLCRLETYISDSTDYDSKTLITPACSSLPDLLSWIESASELRNPAANALADENPEKISRIVLQAEKLVRQQYDHPIGLAQIAEQLNVTPNYLSMLFKKSTGIPFSKFITEIRLAEAPKLLEEPGVTVKEAATRLGYMSSRHFTRLFREKYGMPPTEYINRLS